MTTIIDGTAGITFPVTAGSASAVQASSGRVLQVLNATYGTTTSTTSTTYQDTGLTISITPSSSTSKVLVLVSLSGIYISNASNYIYTNILRGATNIADNWVGIGPYNASAAAGGNGSVNYLDSPATTSSTTYKVQFKSGTSAQSVYVQNGGQSLSTITVMEIAA